MSIDDDYDFEEDEIERGSDDESLYDTYQRVKDNGKKYQEKIDKYKEKRANKNQTSNEFQKPNNEQFRRGASNTGNKVTEEGVKKAGSEATKEFGKEAAKETGKQITKEAGKEVAKEAGKEVAKEAGKTVAKEAGKAAAKEGTKAAVQGATSATGYGIIIAVAIEVLDRMFKYLTDKEYREKQKEKAKKRRMYMLALVIGIFGFFFMFIAAPMYVMSEEGTATLEQIIKKREDRYTEDLHNDTSTKSVTKKTLMMFTNSEYRDLLKKDYDKIAGSSPAQYEDPGYKTTIKNNFYTDIINFFASSEDLKGKDEYDVATNVVEDIIKAEKENFNKIDWYVTSGRNAYSIVARQEFATLQEMQNKDKKPVRSGSISTSELSSGDMQTIPHTELKIPKLSKYDIDPTISNDTQKAYTYANAAQDYVQKWYIPYSIMIDTQDKNFVVNEVIGKMYHPIDFSLFEINRETKKTTVQYYLETTRTKYWEQWDVTTTYEKRKIYEVTRKTLVDEDGNNILDENGKKQYTESEAVYKRTEDNQTGQTSTDPETKSKSLPKSNTRDSKVGLEYFWNEDTTTEKSNTSNNPTYIETITENWSRGEIESETNIFGITKYYKVQTYNRVKIYEYKKIETVKDNTRVETTLTDGGKIAKENGQPMVKKVIVTRSLAPYRYIPKITHAETFYEVIDASYDIIPIDESDAPRTKEESDLDVNWTKEYGEIVTTETWDESITSGNYESKPYKVSYYSDADLEKLNRKVSRIEWFQDWGDTTEVENAIDNGNMNFGSAAATSENMTKLLEQAEKMAQEQQWKYGQGGDRGVSTTLEQLYKKRNIDCSAFVSSLYNIFLGVNPGSWTGGMKDTATAPGSGFVMAKINGDYSKLQLGDILWRSGHVGLYVGNGKQIDAGGPDGVAEPNKANVGSSYTHYIRYVGADLSDAEAPTTGGTGNTGDAGTNTESGPSTEKGIIYPHKTSEDRLVAYNTYGNSKGYSYDDMYFAFNQIEMRLSDIINSNISGANNGFGGFMWPVEITASNPGTNVINCFFGYTPAYGSDHTGIDISRGNINVREGLLTKGPYIVAAHDGTVTRATANPTTDGDGYTFVNIETTDGAYTTQYGHLSEIYVSTGDTVTKGQKIGKMGTTGQSTGVHLHFTVTDSSGGTRLDPLTFYNIAKASDPDTIANLSDINLMSITGIPTGYIYHSEKAAGSELLRDYIRGWEYTGTPPMNAAGTKYIIYDDGVGHATVGYGIDIFNGGFASTFQAAGYPTSIGGEVPVDFVDALEEQEVQSCLEAIMAKVDGLNLKEYQIHALVSRAYNCGVNGATGKRGNMTFVEAYNAYWSENDNLAGSTQVNFNHPLYTNYMAKPNTSNGQVLRGLTTRRQKEWGLFQTGNYDNTY